MTIRLHDIFPLDNLDSYKVHFAKWNQHEEPLDVFTKDQREWKRWQEYPNRMPNLIKPLPSRDAIHEAGHAVVAAVMGMPDIWITVASKRLQCECGSNTPSTYEALAVSYGGYTADTHINLLPESDCLRRSTTDAKHREQIVKSHAPMYHEHIDWSSKLERAKEAAVTVAMVRTEDILQVAREIDKYIETKIDVPCEIVEQWQGIQDARAFGEAMRKRQPDVPIP